MESKIEEKLQEQPKKEWQEPRLTTLDVRETKDGMINVEWEGPWNFLFSS